MALVATIQNKFKENGRIHLEVRYTDTGVDFTETLYFNATDLLSLQKLVNARKAQIAAIYAFADSLTQGQTIDPPPSDPAPTTLQTDSAIFQQDWNRWVLVKRAIDAGILTGSETQVVNFKARVQTEFQQVITDAQAAGQTTAQAWTTVLGLL